jgi:hypothetical protein
MSGEPRYAVSPNVNFLSHYVKHRSIISTSCLGKSRMDTALNGSGHNCAWASMT